MKGDRKGKYTTLKYLAASLLVVALLFATQAVMAQCAICTKVSADQGADVAKGFNAGILYLAAVPFTVAGIIGYQWWKHNGSAGEENNG
jgi:hypothetical protein